MKSSRPPVATADPAPAEEGSFLSRWSRRKAAVREGKPVPPEPVAVPAAPAAEAAAPAQVPARDDPPAPTLADVALLKPGDAISRFVQRGVDEQVKRAALKTLFADPHFNVMDGLDTYIDDYTKPDPIPPHILRQLRQSETLGLFDPIDDEDRTGAEAVAQPAPVAPAEHEETAQARDAADAPRDEPDAVAAADHVADSGWPAAPADPDKPA